MVTRRGFLKGLTTALGVLGILPQALQGETPDPAPTLTFGGDDGSQNVLRVTGADSASSSTWLREGQWRFWNALPLDQLYPEIKVGDWIRVEEKFGCDHIRPVRESLDSECGIVTELDWRGEGVDVKAIFPGLGAGQEARAQRIARREIERAQLLTSKDLE